MFFSDSVLTGIITGVSTILGILITFGFTRLQRKTDASERAFYEVYPRRLAVYDAAIKELEAMIESGESLINLNLTKEAVRDKISKDMHALNVLFTRIRMFASTQTVIIFMGLILEARNELSILYKAGDYVGVLLGRWIDTVRKTLEDFIQTVRKDTGGNFVDRTIRVYFPETKDACFYRIRNKLFPSRWDKDIKKLDKLWDKVQESLRHEENAPIDD
jgi:hypothetical protein